MEENHCHTRWRENYSAKPTSTHSYWKTNLHLLTLNKKRAIGVSRCRFGAIFFFRQTYIYSLFLEKAIRVSRCRFGRINISPANFTSTCFYLDFHAKQVDVHLAGKIILKSPLNAPNNYCQTYRCCCRQYWFCCCILHRRCRCLYLSPVQAPS